jgi:transcriptional antiterminator
MYNNIIFGLRYAPDDTRKIQVDELNSILSKIGVEVKLKTDENYNFLVIEYDNEKVGKKLSRRAGRRKMFAQNPDRLTYNDVRKLLMDHKLDEVAQMLKVSKSTLKRRLKEAKEWDEGDNTFL